MAHAQYNLRSASVKRIMQEIKELKDPTENFHAAPVEDNIFEWHFTVRGPPDSEFDGGVYHGRISLPPDYPLKPPSIMLLTPNGRFETNKKICLSVSSYHPETWQPSWSIRTVLVALIGFFPTPGNGSVAALDCSKDERKKMATKSAQWTCPQCQQPNQTLVLPLTGKGPSAADLEAARELRFVDEKQGETATPAATPLRPDAAAAIAATASSPAAASPQASDTTAPAPALAAASPPTSPFAVAAASPTPAQAAPPATAPPAPAVGPAAASPGAVLARPQRAGTDWLFIAAVFGLMLAIVALLVRARTRDSPP